MIKVAVILSELMSNLNYIKFLRDRHYTNGSHWNKWPKAQEREAKGYIQNVVSNVSN